MAIVRAPRKEGFTVIANDVLRDGRLSFRARGVLASVLSRPDNWATSADRLAAEAKEGRGAVRSALKELEEVGYLVRERVQDEKGRWSTTTVIYDTPTEGQFPAVGSPDVGFSVANRNKDKKEREETTVLNPQPELSRGGGMSVEPPNGTSPTERVVAAWKEAAEGKSIQKPEEIARIAHQALTNKVSEATLVDAIKRIVADGHAIKDWRLTEYLTPRDKQPVREKKQRTITADRNWSAEDYGDETL